METSEEIEKTAAEWAVRLDGRLFEDDPAFLAWASADDRRLGAFVRARAAIMLLGSANGMAFPEGPAVVSRPSIPRRSLVIGAGAAAAATAAAFVLTNRAERLERFDIEAAGVGRQRLSDGTIAWLGPDAAISGAFGRRRRSIELKRGDAWFQVAKDANRPFVVQAGKLKVEAVGTAFSVSRDQDRNEIWVTEGVVEVAYRAPAGESPARLRQGMRALVVADGPLDISSTNADEEKRALAWRDGKVALDGETIEEAARKFNRFNRRKLVVEDELAAETVTGWFEANDPASFAEAVALSFGATLVAGPDELRLSRRKTL